MSMTPTAVVRAEVNRRVRLFVCQSVEVVCQVDKMLRRAGTTGRAGSNSYPDRGGAPGLVLGSGVVVCGAVCALRWPH